MTATRLLLRSATMTACVVLIPILMADVAISASGALTVTSSDGIAWVEGSVAQEATDGIAIKILGPKDGKDERVVIQRCTFTDTAPGTYRCGIEAIGPTPEGTMVARLIVDGERIATTRFSM